MRPRSAPTRTWWRWWPTPTPDTTFYLRSGTHRLSRTLRLKPGQRLIGESGAVLSAAVPVSAPIEDVGGGVFRVAEGIPPVAPDRVSGDLVRFCEAEHPACHLPEQFFVGDRQLEQVARRQDVSGDRFYYDPAGAIYFGRQPAAGQGVEFTVGNRRLIELAPDVELRNLVITRSAGTITRTAVGGPSDATGVVIADNRFHQLAGASVGLPSSSRFTGNVVSEGGQLGINSVGTAQRPVVDVEIIENRLTGNNVDGWRWVHEAGGSKFVRVHGLVARGNHVVGNNGAGLWSDADNVDHLYEYNVAVDNIGDSYFYEISRQGTIRYNEATQTGTSGAGSRDRQRHHRVGVP